ncbi:DUF2183 domain-containing protein [Ornithinimicrobium faecis]|uniref:DUF2183 domain-containing protein n=1 Tax=Ornithinimicrobium faecis TaxID=2934158 RepID=A0ABY4YTZ7_9MICO|nr:phosphatase domain-containing protein [Ornithinimicrobium sp. HY1793]USQ80230.1 DUF2183 domain-containing protein [Ornithinimicrobium sp. HY1793]
MARPHIAALLEDAFVGRVEAVLRRRGWQERVTGYTGYGTTEQARILARVLLSRGAPRESGSFDDDIGPEPVGGNAVEQAAGALQHAVRGWRNFITAPAQNVPVTVTLGEAELTATVDRGGYLDIELDGHDLEPGWHDAVIRSGNGDTVRVPVRILSPQTTVGVVSDIDDTVMVTHLPRLMIAMWNTFFRDELAREPVTGMAPLLRSLVAEGPDTPVFYLSTGAWNTAPTLTRFLRRHKYPEGPLLLTDWGATNTGWFRSGQEHKITELHRLLRDFPDIRWVLIGDDGQHDPMIYGDFTRQHPDAVEAVLIRQLTTAQQVLSHGLPIANDELLGKDYSGVPMLRAPDGFRLHAILTRSRAELARLRPKTPLTRRARSVEHA